MHLLRCSIFYEPHEFYSNVNDLIESDKGGVAVATGWKITKMDVPNKTVTLDDNYEIKYDKCLIATGKCREFLFQDIYLHISHPNFLAGASPKNLPVFESLEDDLKEKIITFRTREDFLDLEDNVNDPNCKNIVIIGGGFLGSELACSLARNCTFFSLLFPSI